MTFTSTASASRHAVAMTPKPEKEGCNEINILDAVNASLADLQKQTSLPLTSVAYKNFISSASLMEFLFHAVFILAVITATTFGDGASIPPAEQEAAYLSLESINSAVEWRALYPDDMCLSGPHGVVCDLFPDTGVGGFTPHVTELNFGYLPDIAALASKNNRLHDAFFFRDEMKAMGLPPDVNLYNFLISVCARSKNSGIAIKLLEEMKKHEIKLK